MQYNGIAQARRILKFIDGCKSSQVYVVDSSNCGSGGGGCGGGVPSDGQERSLEVSKLVQDAPSVAVDNLLSRALPETDLLEPQIDPWLKPLNMVETLAYLYRRIEDCSEEEKFGVYLEQCAVFRGFPDPKMLQRSLCAAQEHVVDVHSNIVLASWRDCIAMMF